MKADDGVARDMVGSTSRYDGRHRGRKPAVSPGTQAYLDRMSQNYYLCEGWVHAKGDQPLPARSAKPARQVQIDR